jgi:ABC-type Mn2+/Zn2+ transport system ATPase subunit
MKMPYDPRASRFILHIEADGLFGQFKHDLKFKDKLPEDPNLLILYGENGTGKTTLLWLLYHLLNREVGKGHRSFLAKHRFQRLCVTFNDGLQISATRQTDDIGSFLMTVSHKSKTITSFQYEVAEDGLVKILSNPRGHTEFVEQLPHFNLAFLAHSRLTKPDDDPRSQHWRSMAEIKAGVKSVLPTQVSIAKALGIARQQAITASNAGQFTANSIYAELMERISQMRLPVPESGVEDARQNLIQRLELQSKTTAEYSSLGLISELQVQGLMNPLKSIAPDRLHLAIQIFEPFLQGNEARFEALRSLYIALTTMVESVNSLYLNKKISLHLEKGLQIFASNNQQLKPSQLSSGEQELMILFCEVIGNLRPHTILLIDEPELSLNVTWQKSLLKSLLRCASGVDVQFLVATHSIELLAHHRGNVTRLSTEQISGESPEGVEPAEQ